MAGRTPYGNPVPVSDLATKILDPVLRKRAGISIGLVQSWEEIAGPRLASRSRPEKIQWPRRLHEDDPFEPAVLVIACEGMAALHLQHETGEIAGRKDDGNPLHNGHARSLGLASALAQLLDVSADAFGDLAAAARRRMSGVPCDALRPRRLGRHAIGPVPFLVQGHGPLRLRTTSP